MTSSESLGESLKDVIVKRRQGDGEFSYVYLPSGDIIAGKKAAFRALQADEAMYENLRDSCRMAGETDTAFDARVLRLIVSVPFEDTSSSSVTPKKTPAKTAAAPVTPKTPAAAKTILKDSGPRKELQTKNNLSKLISRRRLEGGEFSYVYIPLEKVINGKKAMYQFLKNQGQVFTNLKKLCQEDGESDEAFDARIMKEMLTVPYEKEIIASPMDTDAGLELPATKRKSNLDTIEENKKQKMDTSSGGPAQYVFFDTEILSVYNKVYIWKRCIHPTQYGAITQDSKKFFKPVIADYVNTASDNILEKLNREKKGKFQFTFKRLKGDVTCSKLMPALTDFVGFLEEVKSKASKVILVGYRRDAFKPLFTQLDRFTLRHRFQGAVDTCVVLEEVFQQKPLKQYLPVKSIVELYSKTMGLSFNMKNPTCEDFAELLMKSCNVLMKKHNFQLSDFSCNIKTMAEWKDFRRLDSNWELPEDSFAIFNSNTFAKKELFKLSDGGASTSKVVSTPRDKPLLSQKQIQKASQQNKNDPEIIEMDVDEDNFEFSPVGQEILYQVLCQPVLVKLGTMDENTKFIKFSLSPQMTKRARGSSYELLKDSSKVFWRNDTPYAFCNLCPEIAADVKYKPLKAKIVDTLGAGQTLGTYKALNRTDEDQRYLSTKVQVDIVVTRAGNEGMGKVNVNTSPSSVLVKLILKPGSLTDGDLADFQFRPSDVIICHKAEVKGLSVVSKFISVDRKQGVANRAKIIVKSASHQLLSEGTVIATGTLFQNDVKLVFQTLDLQTQTNSDIKSSSNVALMQVQSKNKRPLKTMGGSRLYAQGINPVLVKLDQYEATRLNPKFAKAYIEYSVEFNDIIDQNSELLKIDKMSEKEKVVRVFWNKNIPYTFVNIKIPPVKNQAKVDFCDIIQNYEIGSYAPLEIGDPMPAEKITMHLCVDFDEKNCVVETIPTIIKVYLKFKDTEIDKKEVIAQYFAVTKTHHRRLEILSVVINPNPHSKLAPQKTATNDMKATLLVKSCDDEPVILNAREVLADCDSLDPLVNINNFSVCGKKVKPASQRNVMMSQEIEEMEMMDRQFNARGGGDMYTRRGPMMSQMDRFSNPWDDGDMMEEEGYGRHHMMNTRGRGGMMNTRGRGMMRPNMGMDMDFRGGGFNDHMMGGGGMMGRGGFSRGGFNKGGGNAGGMGRGGMNNGRGNSFSQLGNLKNRNAPKKKEDDNNVAVNPEFDSLYEPEFNSKNAAFEKARAKLNSRVPSNPRGGTSGFGGGPGSYRGGRGGGPPKSTWSN